MNFWSGNRKSSPGTEGFTLVEVLVALSVTSILFATMSGMISQFRRLQAVEQKQLATMEVEALENYLRRTIQSALPTPLSLAGGQRVLFDGSSTGLRFVGIVRGGVGSYRLADVSISYDEDAGMLAQKNMPRRARTIGTDAKEGELLSSGVESLSFSYGSGSASGNRIAWVGDWQTPGKLPVAIKITGVVRRGDALLPVEVIAVPDVSH